MKRNTTTQFIVFAMILGVLIGYLVHENFSTKAITDFSANISLLGTIFIRLIQMIIAPLVFSTLVVGISKIGDIKTVGRVGLKAMTWFITASLISLLLGLILVNILHPGANIDLSIADTKGIKDIGNKVNDFSLQHFIEKTIPKSFFEAMASNEILQVVFFSLFFGTATLSLGSITKPLIHSLEVISHVILKMVSYIMKFAPLGVLGSISAVVAQKGLGVFHFYFGYFISFLLGIGILWFILLLVGYLILGKRLKSLLKHITNPILIALTTTTSEAVFPKLTEELERFGCSNKIVSFILPLGYSFNLDGSMMYMTFAIIAIAQAYKINLPLSTQIIMLLVLMLTSKGVAGVPRSSLVVVMATCSLFKIPPEGIALILPIDHFCDMFRTATNVVGNALATSAVSKWEGALSD